MRPPNTSVNLPECLNIERITCTHACVLPPKLLVKRQQPGTSAVQYMNHANFLAAGWIPRKPPQPQPHSERANRGNNNNNSNNTMNKLSSLDNSDASSHQSACPHTRSIFQSYLPYKTGSSKYLSNIAVIKFCTKDENGICAITNDTGIVMISSH